MNTNDTLREKLAEAARYAYSRKEEIKNPGLIGGRTGLCINLYHIAEFTRDDGLRAKAENLLDEIYRETNMSLPIHFSNGLTGIAWGLQHLISESFVDGEAIRY